jgi:hypothetical protein
MKKILLSLTISLFSTLVLFSQGDQTILFTIFTSYGCGCTGSGGAPESFTSNDQVLSNLRTACEGIDFMVWEGTRSAAYEEIEKNPDAYDGVLIIGGLDGDFRLAFTGLPTIAVYNLWEFMNQPWDLFATGKMRKDPVLTGGRDYEDVKVLTAQLDRRNLCDPAVTAEMFNDLVDKVKLIQVVKRLKETRILMVKNSADEIISSVNYRGDINQSFPGDHNSRYLSNFRKVFGAEIISVEPEAFYDMYQKIPVEDAEKTAELWMAEAERVEASKREITKTARGYLALDALREKYGCNSVATHIRTVTGSGEIKDRYNPGVGLELGFKARGIQAVCQNYPDILMSQVLAYLLTGRPSMLGDIIFDVYNNVEIVLHCGIPINPLGTGQRLPYVIRTHAESPVRDIPEEPGSSTGMTVEWPAGKPATFWEIHSLNRTIRMNAGETVNGYEIYTGGEDLYNVMCTAKVIARVEDAKKLRDQHLPYLYGIHTNVTLGDLRQQLRDMAVLLGFDFVESDR